MTDDLTHDHLRALLADATARAEKAEAERDALKARADVAEAEITAIISVLHGPTMRPLAELVRDYVVECGRLSTVVGYVAAWTHEYGAALKPPGADTYGEGKRDAKNEVAAILRGKP